MLGVGEALLEQWTIFGVRWGIYVGFCFVGCFCACFVAKNGDSAAAGLEAGSGMACFYCLILLASVAMWIVEIITVADGELGPANGCGYKD